MPIEFDLIGQLSNPLAAITFASTPIATVGFLTYRFLVGCPRSRRDVYLRGIAFIAEIFTAVGLIGLITFAGRAKLDSKGYERAEATRVSEQALSNQFARLAYGYCIKPNESGLSSNAHAAIDDACALWHTYSAIYNKEIDWLQAQESFEEIAARPQLDTRLVTSLQMTAQAVGNMRDARYQEALVPLEKKLVMQRISWPLVLLCSILAGLGVALKCARSACEFRQQLKPAS